MRSGSRRIRLRNTAVARYPYMIVTIEESREEPAVVLSPVGRLDGAGAPAPEARVSAVT